MYEYNLSNLKKANTQNQCIDIIFNPREITKSVNLNFKIKAKEKNNNIYCSYDDFEIIYTVLVFLLFVLCAKNNI